MPSEAFLLGHCFRYLCLLSIVCCFLFTFYIFFSHKKYTKKLIDLLAFSAELNRTVITLFLIYVGAALFGMGRSWLFTLAGHRVVVRLRKNLFSSIIRQEVAFFDTNR